MNFAKAAITILVELTVIFVFVAICGLLLGGLAGCVYLGVMAVIG